MTRYAVLLRGVNVSGKNRLPMAEFRDMLADLGFDNPVTYIQSGNAVVDSTLGRATVEEMIGQGIAARFGITTAVLALTTEEMVSVIDGHPFSLAEENRVHAFFLRGPQPGLTDKALAALAAPGDEWCLLDHALVLHTPQGVGNSKLAERLPKMIQGPATARNLRSAKAILDLMRR